MSVVEARVRVHHPCPYCDVSTEFPRTLLLLWCDNRRDVFLVSSPDSSELRDVLSALRDSFHSRTLVVDGRDALVTIPDFEWADPPSVTGLARKSGVWVLHPVVYYEGKETYRLVAPSKVELSRLITKVRRLGDVEILSVSDRRDLAVLRDVPNASGPFFEGLTDRQARSLVAAFEGGLFNVPTRASWSEVARRQGLSRSTFGEHLRKGQLRLLENSHVSLKARIDLTETPQLLLATTSPQRRKRAPNRGIRSR